MIDIENKIICFGYGDVQVGSTWSVIKFRGFKPPVEIGTIITDEVIEDNNLEYITEPIAINFATIEELINFKKLVEDIDGNNNICFEYCGYTFDFSNYNQKSIEVVLYHIGKIRQYLVSLMAC